MAANTATAVQQTAVQPAGTKVLLDTGTIRVRYRGTHVKIPVLYILVRVLIGVLDLPNKYTQKPVTYRYVYSCTGGR